MRWMSAAGGPKVRTNIGSMALDGILWREGVHPQDGTIGPVGAPATVPDQPTDLSAPDTEDAQATIYFTPGANGGSPITNYQYSLDGGITFNEFNPAVTTSPVTVTNLFNNTTYSIILQAINTTGTSPSSAPISVTPRGLPDAPIFVSYVRGSNNVRISFKDGPSDGGSPVTGYWYAYSTDGGDTFTDLFSTSVTKNQSINTMQINGLDNATAYIFILAESNKYGIGQQSDEINVAIVGPPNAPFLTGFANGNTTVDIFFTAGSDGGSPITNYKYALSVDSGTTWTSFVLLSPADTSTPITITGLNNSLTYSVKLKAVNAIGDSSESNPLSGINPYNAPTPPTNLVATPGNTYIDVSFNVSVPEAGSGYVMVNYEYSFNNGVSYTAVDPSDNNPPVRISGLTNGTTYSLRLRGIATNDSGATYIRSGQSAAVSAKPVGPPLAPTNLVAAPGNGTASISFTAGSNGGSAITNYQYSLNGGGFTLFSPAVTTSPFSFTGLTNGTTYTYSFKAVNAIGTSGASNTVAVTPNLLGTPVIQKGIADNGGAYVYFTQPYGTVTNYKYTTNGGTTYTTFSPVTTTSPLRISPLTNDVSANIQIVAIGSTPSQVSGLSNVLTVTPTSIANALGPSLYYDASTNPVGTVRNSGTFGTLTGTMTNVTLATGPKGYKVFNFPGNGYISFGRYNFGTAVTLSAWINPSSTSNINGLLSNAVANQAPSGFKMGWNSWLQNNRVCYFEAGNGGGGGANATAVAVTYGVWQHFGCVFDQANSLVIFFINGVPVNIGGIVTQPNVGMNNASFNIGSFVGPSYYTTAQVGYVKIYNYLFNANDMYSEYLKSKGRFGL
jgi:titin